MKSAYMPPDHYSKLPKGVRCRCLRLWSYGEDYYCCKGATAASATNIVPIGVATTAQHKTDAILEAAKGQGIERILVIGQMPDGTLWFSGSHSDDAGNLLALERAKLRFIRE